MALAGGHVGGTRTAWQSSRKSRAARVAKTWHELWRVGRECKIGFVGVESSPVETPSPPAGLRYVCGSFSAHTASATNDLHPALHVRRCVARNRDHHGARRKNWLLPRSVCIRHHCSATQFEWRMEHHQPFHHCVCFVSVFDGPGERSRRAVKGFLPAPTGLGRQRVVASTLLGGSAWQVNSPPRWACRPPWRSSTSRGVELLHLSTMGVTRGFPLRLLHFLIGAQGGPRFLGVESVATKVVRSGGPAVVAGCARTTTHEARWLTQWTTPSRNCPRPLPQWSWTTHSSRQSVKEPPGRSSLNQESTCSQSTGLGGLFQEAGDHYQRREGSYRCGKEVHADAHRTCTRNLCDDYACGGDRTGAKFIAERAKLCRGEMSFSKRLRQAGTRIACLVNTAAVPSPICGSDDGHAASAAQRSVADR